MSQQPVFAAPQPATYGPQAAAPAKPACPASRPDKASAMFAARQCGGKVEVMGLRSETTIVWAEADGSYTSERSLGIARFQRDGQWVDVDLNLVRQADGSVAPKAHPSGVKLAGAGDGVKELASLGSGDDKLAVAFEGKLPQPLLEGTTATYREVFPGIDIVVEVRRYGYEQSYVVKDKAALAHVPAALKALRLKGPPAEPDGNGGLLFKDKTGKRVGRSPMPLMWDAARESGNPEPVNVKPLGVTLDGRKQVGALTADNAWLNDPARQFPITIDPYEGLEASFDTYVQSGQSGYFDTSTKLAIGTQNSGSTQRMAYVKVGTAEMRSATINFATLKLWGTVASSCENSVWLLFVGVTDAYQYTNWNGRPDLYDRNGNNIGKDGSGYSGNPNPAAAFGGSLAPTSGGCTGQWIGADAADALRFAIARGWGEVTLAMTPYWRDTNSYYKEFYSLDSGTLPHVVVNWNDPPAVSDFETVPATSSCTTGANRPYITSKTPKLRTTVTDSDNAPSNVRFEWWTTGGSMIGNQTVSNVPSGAIPSVDVPTGAFAENGTYSWRVMAGDPSGAPFSAWSPWCEFTVDTIKPGTPIVTSKDGKYPSTSTDNTWGHGGYGQGGTFTLTPGAPSGDLASFTYQLDNQSTSTTVSATAAADITVTPSEDGVRTLTVSSKDKAGNVSDAAKYIFNVGRAGLSQPRPGANVFKRANLDVDGDAAFTRTRFQVRRGPGSPEYDIPWTNMTTATGTAVTGGAGQPVAISSLGNYGVWNAIDTLGTVGGVAQVRARLYGAGGFVSDLSVRHPTSGRCLDLDSYGTINGTLLQMFDCHGLGNQRFELMPDGSIVNPLSGRCLDAANGGVVDNTTIWLWDCHGGPNQKFERLADGQIRNPVSGKCLNIQGGAPFVNGQKIILWTCIGASNMIFADLETAYNTQWITINVDTKADGAATADVGPGSVNLVTGDLNVGGADASAFGLGTGRTLSTRDTQAGWVPQKERLSTAGQQATDLTQYTAGFSDLRIVTGRGQGGSNEALEIVPAGGTGRLDGDTFASVGGDAVGMRLGMQTGKRYRATGWIYVPAATGLSPTHARGNRIVAFVNAAGAYTEFRSPQASFVDGWQQLSVDFTVPANATEAFIRVYNGQASGTGKLVYWDNLSLKEIITPFGPQWSSGAGGGPAAAAYTTLEFPSADVVKVNTVSGSYLTFGKSTTGTYFPQPGAEDLTLTLVDADHYRLSGEDGTVVEFTQVTTGKWVVTSTWTEQTASTTSYVYDTADDRAILKRVIAPTESGIGTCNVAVPAKGCRVLEYDYAAATTATATVFGDYAGRVRSVKVWSWDPAASAVNAVEVAHYAYDTSGNLREVWDPRLDWTDEALHHLKVTYQYDADGVLVQTTPVAQEPWNLLYTTVPGDAGKGRLAKVNRSALTAGTATTTVVYGVPLSGTGSPFDMSATNVSRWSTQLQLPTEATAVFPPTQIPDGNQATGVKPSSWAKASVTYMDVNGRVTNQLSPGGHLNAAWYDVYGNVVQELSPGSRKRALDASTTDNAAAEAQLGYAYSSLSTYSPDGRRKVSSLGPLHSMRTEAGSLVSARTQTTYVYDEGAPVTGDVFDRVTTETTQGTRSAGGGTAVLFDPRVQKTEYDWNIEQPTKSIVDPAGLALATRTGYDAQERVVTQTNPAGGSVDTTPSTRVTVYYSVAANGTYPQCGNRPEWAGLVCLTKPGGQPAAGQQLPTTTTTYDRYQQAAVTTESTSVGTLRSTTVIYDTAGRASRTTLSAPGLGEPVQTRRIVYDQASGQAVKTQTLDGSNNVTAEIVRTYDTLGRLASYKDADNNLSTTSFDIASRPLVINDGKATRTYTYDETLEPRGLATKVVDSNVGQFTGTYDADGNLVTQVWPNGVNVTTTFDETGAAVGLAYVQPGCGLPDCTLYTETNTLGAHGQVLTRVSSLSSQTYAYDKAGRLSSVADTAGGYCHTRVYTFDTATNRSGQTNYGPGANGACQSTTASGTTTWTYDTADRATSSGYTYDALGRTLTMPGADTAIPGGGTDTMTYHANNMVRSVSQGTRTTVYTLDVVTNRFRSWTDNASGSVVTKRNHYADDEDNPVWTEEGNGTDYTRSIAGLGGICAVHAPNTGEFWVITNLHGDFIAGLPETGYGIAYTGEQTENGLPRNSADAGNRRYGWLGSAQRASDTPGGLTLMGSRLYAPGDGRFLSTDPVYGGSANPYEYCAGDSINCADTAGTYRVVKKWGRWYWLWWAPWTGKWGAGFITIKFSKRETSEIAWWGARVLVAMGIVGTIAGLMGAVIVPVVLAVLGAIGFWIVLMAEIAERYGRCLWMTAYGVRLPGAMHFNALFAPGRC